MKKDLAASIRARLLAVAKAQGADFNQVLVRFALERLLYRLCRSEHSDRFLLRSDAPKRTAARKPRVERLQLAARPRPWH